MSKRFPKFSKVEEAKCFNCATSVRPSNTEESGHAPGNGQYRAWCATCKMCTWFDLKRAA